jgi:acetylornithine/succinyldiaminopimelate/putrescine aminotransferase
MPPVPNVNGSSRNYPRPGSLGGDRASAMARPAIATAVPGTSQRNQVIATGATSGTFARRIQGRGGDIDVTTAAINFNDSLATLVSKVDAALPADEVVTGISGGPLPAASVFEFTSEEAYTVTVVNNALVGGTPVVSTTQAATGYVKAMASGTPRGFRGTRSSAMARPRGFGR